MKDDLPIFNDLVMNLKGEAAYSVLASANDLEKQGRDIIHLEIGQPDFNTSEHIKKVAIASLINNETRYESPLGLSGLRQVIADNVSQDYRVAVSIDNVAVTPSAKLALYLSMVAILSAGDEVVYPDPGFPAYENIARLLGCVPRPLPLLEKNNFSFDIKTFQQILGPKTKLVILNSPSNPTGNIIPEADLQVIADLAQKYNFWIITDEIYNKIIYDDVNLMSIFSLPNMKERTILINGFSKTYAMAGWRLGYMIVPERLISIIENLLVNSFACTATFIQRAGIEALTQGQNEVDLMVAEFLKRRNLIVNRLNNISGISCVNPQGAFYAFPNIKNFRRSSVEIAKYLLDEAGVAVLPGTAFGQYGEGYLRISYANSLEKIILALDKIENALKKIL